MAPAVPALALACPLALAQAAHPALVGLSASALKTVLSPALHSVAALRVAGARAVAGLLAFLA